VLPCYEGPCTTSSAPNPDKPLPNPSQNTPPVPPHTHRHTDITHHEAQVQLQGLNAAPLIQPSTPVQHHGAAPSIHRHINRLRHHQAHLQKGGRAGEERGQQQVVRAVVCTSTGPSRLSMQDTQHTAVHARTELFRSVKPSQPGV
jgi:hypothetical protein